MENNICEVCGSLKKLIPAGISKISGKSYQAFYACPNKCGKKGNSYQPKQETSSEAVVEGLRAIYKEIAEINIAVKLFLTKK